MTGGLLADNEETRWCGQRIVMDFKTDLKHIIERQFEVNDVRYVKTMDVGNLAARYLEMLNRRIVPVRRSVHFSEEIHESLDALRWKADAEHREEAKDAWGAVSWLRYLLAEGMNVNGFLSKGIDSATGARSKDHLLWDYGIHHFHLSREVDTTGFVKRADYLLFAIVTKENAYFVDVRPHHEPDGLEWVRQDLLKIVYSNWPEIVEPHILRGVNGTVVTDKEKAELRRKSCNLVTDIGGQAIAPIGGGIAGDGSSVACRYLAMKLLHEIGYIQDVFEASRKDLRTALREKGYQETGEPEFELVLLDGLNWSDELVASLMEDGCLSRDLCQMGFAVAERTTGWPMVVRTGVSA